MALTEETILNRIEIMGDGTMFVEMVTRVLRDGVEIARSYDRGPGAYAPGSELPVEVPQVAQDVAATVWTPETVTAYEEQKVAEQAAADAMLGVMNGTTKNGTTKNGTT